MPISVIERWRMKLPEFVKLLHDELPLYFRLTRRLNDEVVYHRDLGKWDMGFERINGILVAKTPYNSMLKNFWDGLPLVEATKEEYERANKDGLPPDWVFAKDETKTAPLVIRRPARSVEETEVLTDIEEPPLDLGENDDFTENFEDEENDPNALVESNMDGVPEDQEPVFRAKAGEYFYIGDSRENEFYFLRAKKSFEIFEKGRVPWDLVSDLEYDGLVDILPDVDNQDGLDFAYE
jgi:hypothetical protein